MADYRNDDGLFGFLGLTAILEQNAQITHRTSDVGVRVAVYPNTHRQGFAVVHFRSFEITPALQYQSQVVQAQCDVGVRVPELCSPDRQGFSMQPFRLRVVPLGLPDFGQVVQALRDREEISAFASNRSGIAEEPFGSAHIASDKQHYAQVVERSRGVGVVRAQDPATNGKRPSVKGLSLFELPLGP